MGANLCTAVEVNHVEGSMKDVEASTRMVPRAKAHCFPYNLEGTGNGAPKVVDLCVDGGELVIFLERVTDIPNPSASFQCQGPAQSRGFLSIRAWAEDKTGQVLGRVASWPAKHCRDSASWFSSEFLGFSIAQHKDAVLRMELRQKDRVLAELREAFEDLLGHAVIKRSLDIRLSALTGKCNMSFQILDSRVVSGPRTVFFVRHGESVWNAAQSNMRLDEMAGSVDHPLSQTGRVQSELLAQSLKTASDSKEIGMNIAQLLRPDAVFVSPLTRAVQTAIIALGEHLVSDSGESPELVLMGSAREKQNLGGFDTMSTKLDADIIDHSIKELRSLYKENDTNVRMFEALDRLRFDALEVQDPWWCETLAESSSQLKERLEEFKNKLLYSPMRSLVVVGHSHFFRAFFKSFTSDAFKTKKPELASNLAVKKLINCGVVRVELDSNDSTGPIADAQLVLGTELIDDEKGGPGALGCSCGAPDRRAVDEEVITTSAMELDDRVVLKK